MTQLPKSKLVDKLVKLLDFYDHVEPCEPDCTPERHAYHQGQWDMAGRMNEAMGLEWFPQSDEAIKEALKRYLEIYEN